MLNYIDLFAGAGGLSEGFVREGFNPVAHVEMNPDACKTIETRIAYLYLKSIGEEDTYYRYLKGDISRKEFLAEIPEDIKNSVINSEISSQSIPQIFDRIDSLINGENVDLIIGGPPCQAYSVAGRARDPKNMQDDPRNYLYLEYVKFLKKFRPKMFVFENVPGITSANNGEHFENIKKAIDAAGYKFDFKILNSRDYGVLQDRKRVILIGWQKNLKLAYPEIPVLSNNHQILKDLFSDLPKIQNGGGTLGVSKYRSATTEYLQKSGIRNGLEFTTQHVARPNNENDLEIYRIAVRLMNEGKRLQYGELPERLIKHKNRNVFTNRFQVVKGDGISHTVVAHIAMDGHYYIHPDIKQNRSITVREAARIQSFPDDFFFEGSRTAAFKQIGNAVPPLMANQIAKVIKKLIS